MGNEINESLLQGTITIYLRSMQKLHGETLDRFSEGRTCPTPQTRTVEQDMDRHVHRDNVYCVMGTGQVVSLE